ncbi:putative oxidoreductase [Nonlabens dokdonensis]|jgi:predicted oxidoreductase|uniref:Oxidoreductase n=2 Tax=Nonlabens dokdonensis TaxID=328515 RepID=L7WD50_NONDD|nr:aldo/keto reductase [Nonlabens dokdonensis]AGC77846.1 oxidoreductase [Nonlabens dokdonensis DSW-6]PZX39623.1 putative oxidoreductase [Nonlabens dokdonensis]
MKINLQENLEISRLVLGLWRLLDWNMTDQELHSFIKECMENGVTTLDHADIYGNHECESAFGKAMQLEPSLRDQMQLITKCGIKLNTNKFPDRKVKYYDYSASYIVQQAEESLKNLQTDRLDVLLLHRPSPFFNPEEVASAFDHLKTSGKVLHFGVSNFLPEQLQSLQNHLDVPLVTNQIEISPYCLEHFENQNLDYLISKKIPPMAWSPLAGGELFDPKTTKGKRVQKVLENMASKLGNLSLDKIILQWLLMHPSRIIPVLGTGKIDRIKSAVDAMQVKLTLEQWFEIYIAAAGKELP